MHEAIIVTTKSSIKRLNRVCHSDVFANALINFEACIHMLVMSGEEKVAAYFAEYNG